MAAAAAMLSVAAYPMQDDEEPIPLRVGRINPTPTEPPHPKSPSKSRWSIRTATP